MPIYTTRPPVARIHGKLTSSNSTAAVVVTDSPTTAPTMRRHCETVKQPSAVQTATRVRIGANAKAYHALSHNDALAWRIAAEHINRTNSLGAQYTFTGISLFQQVNYYRQLAGYAISPTPPADFSLPQPIASIYFLTYEFTELHLRARQAGNGSNAIGLLRCTPSSTNQARIPTRSELRIITTDPSTSMYSSGGPDYEWFLPIQTVRITPNEYLRFEITMMTIDFLPRPAQMFPLMQIVPL